MAEQPLSVVVVTYNSRREIDACLEGLYADLGLQSAQVIVVDNASMDGTAEHVREQWPRVTLLAEARNHGFAGANNIGLSAATGDPILLLNPDTVVQPGALSAMRNTLHAHAEAGVVGPMLLNPDRTLQPSCREFPNLLGDLIGMAELYRLGIVRRLLRRRMPSLGDHSCPRRVDWLNGACLLIRRAAIETVGLMDPGFFMYSEEMEWQYRLALRGWSAWFEPSAKVTHMGGASTAAVPGQRIVWQYQSILRFYQMYRSPLQRLALRLLIWAVTWPKIIYLALRSRSSLRRRELLRAFLHILVMR